MGGLASNNIGGCDVIQEYSRDCQVGQHTLFDQNDVIILIYQFGLKSKIELCCTSYSSSKEMEQKQKQQKTRCALDGCNKKITLVDYACKCANTYCRGHRVPETHNCTYDFREEHKKQLLMYMERPIIAKKIEIL